MHYTRFLSGTCLGEWRKNELKNIQHAILYHTYAYDIILYYDVLKIFVVYTCGSMHVTHSSRDPQAYRSQGPITKTRKPQ